MMIDLDDGFIDMRGGTEILTEEILIVTQEEPNEEGVVECTYLNGAGDSVTIFVPQDRIE
jgi:hypothetical protein